MPMKNAFGLIGIVLGLVLIASLGFGVVFTSGCGSTSSSTATSSVEAGSPTATTETLAIARLVTVGGLSATEIDLMNLAGSSESQRQLIQLVSISGASAGTPRGLAWLSNKYLLVSTSNEYFDPWAVAPDGFHQIAVDKSDPTSKSIANNRPSSYTTGTINVDVQVGGVANNNHTVQIWSRGAAAAASTTGSSATLTGVPIFADGVNWLYAFDADGKEAWQAVPFAGGTVNVTVNLSAGGISPGHISSNPTYKTYNYSGSLDKIYSTTVSSTQEVGSSFSLKKCLAISPAANVVYYAQTNAGTYLTKIMSYTISTGSTAEVFDTLTLSNAIIPSTFYQFDFSANGSKLYFVAGPTGVDTIYQLDLATSTATAVYSQSQTSVGYIADLAVDPNGNYVYFVNSTTKDLYRVSADTANPTTANQAVRLTTSGDVSFVAATTL